MSVNFRFIIILAAFAFTLFVLHEIWWDLRNVIYEMEDIKRELGMRRK
jgi:hypothetical protein